jgi:hypothetical protein
MNGPCRETPGLRTHNANREQGFASLQGHHANSERCPGAERKKELKYRQVILCWIRYFGTLRDLLVRPRLPEKYYQYIESVGMSRAEMVFLISFFIALGPASYTATKNLMNGMPEVDLIAHAQASETIQSNKYRKTDKDGFFLEDCY